MIKYRVRGQFLSEDKRTKNICSDFFVDTESPFRARKEAIKYFNNFIELLIVDFNIDFKTTFQEKKKSEINGEVFEHNSYYKIVVEYTFDDMEFYEIVYFGIVDNSEFDVFVNNLYEELVYYKLNNFKYENPKTVSYYEFEENDLIEIEILETLIDFKGKDKPLWWLNKSEKIDLIKQFIEEKKLENELKLGENNLVEYKPSLLYNFKTQKASIGVKNIIAKVICSFLNSNGGKLLIGIKDNGDIQGLDYDFSLKTKEDEFDFFRNEFDNLLFQFFDKKVYNYIKADFNFKYDKTIFEIKIKPSDTPFFLLNKSENTKEFYIRTITSSVLISDVEEIVAYSLSHWKDKL